MLSLWNRREFLSGSLAMGACLTTGRISAATFQTTLRKSLIGAPDESTLTRWKALGFDGMESSVWNISPDKAALARQTAEKIGMKIHSVLFGWANFNATGAVEEDLKKTQTALRAAEGFGADALLLVPCRIGGMPMPNPWEFELRFDEKTGHVKQVVAENNDRFSRYIEAHNHAIDTSREAITKLIPLAEKTGVIIALENVWNNLWVKPEIFAHFVTSFESRWVKAYFDIGNHVKYAPPQDWIRALGKQIVRCHVKDFKLKADGHGGEFVAPCDGSVDWPAVRQALDEIGYNGWLTVEDNRLSLEEYNRRLDGIIGGENRGNRLSEK